MFYTLAPDSLIPSFPVPPTKVELKRLFPLLENLVTTISIPFGYGIYDPINPQLLPPLNELS